jgi:hypothetical protein
MQVFEQHHCRPVGRERIEERNGGVLKVFARVHRAHLGRRAVTEGEAKATVLAEA